MGKPGSFFHSGGGKPLLGFSLLPALFLLLLIQGPAVAGPVAGQGCNVPDKVKLDSLQDKYGPVLFDHTKHTQIAEGCFSCHHEHPNVKELNCSNCHKLDADVFKKSVTNCFMACKNCHTGYDPKNPGQPGLKVAYHKQCFKCHAGMGDVGTDPKGCTTLCHTKNP